MANEVLDQPADWGEHVVNPDEFAKELNDYLSNGAEAKAKKLHHDYRRSLFVAFVALKFKLEERFHGREGNFRNKFGYST